MRVEWGVDVVPFVMKAGAVPRDFGPCVTAAVVTRNDEPAAGIVFHNYSPEHGVIEVSAAAVRADWAQRGVLKELCGYAFSIAQMVVFRTSEHNTKVRTPLKRAGATEYVIPRYFGRTEAGVILTLTDDAWRASKLAR